MPAQTWRGSSSFFHSFSAVSSHTNHRHLAQNTSLLLDSFSCFYRINMLIDLGKPDFWFADFIIYISRFQSYSKSLLPLIFPTGDDTAVTLTIKCASLTKSNLLETAFLLHSFRLQESKYDTRTAEGSLRFIQKSNYHKILL